MSKPFFVKGLHNIILYVGIMLFYPLFYGLYYEMYYDWDFRVLGVSIVCEQPLNNRCSNEYQVVNSDGTSSKIPSHQLVAFDPDDLRIGNVVKKNKFSFEAEVNGTRKFWPEAGQTIAILALQLLAVGIWRVLTPLPKIPKTVVVEVSDTGFLLDTLHLLSRSDLAQALMKRQVKLVNLQLRAPVSAARIEEARLAIQEARASVSLESSAAG